MALARIKELIPRVFKDESIEDYVSKSLKETQKELESQAHFVASSGWKAIYEKYYALIKNEEEKIVYFSSDVIKYSKDIKKSHDLARSMRLLLSLTDGILQTFNQNKEGKAKNTEPVDGMILK